MIMLLFRSIIFPMLTWDAGLMVSFHMASLVFSGLTCLVLHWTGNLVA